MHNYNIIPILEEIEFKQHKHLQPHLIEKYSHFNKRKMYDMENCGHFLKFGLFLKSIRFFSSEKLEEMYTCKNRFCPFCSWRRSRKLSLQGYKILDAIRQKKILDIFFNSYCTKSKIRRYSFNNFI